MSSFPASAASDPRLPHDSLVSHIVGICSAMMVLVTLVVAVRFWIRFKLVKGRFGADDWCILLSWILAIAYDLDPLNQTRFGLGKHTYDLGDDVNFTTSLKVRHREVETRRKTRMLILSEKKKLYYFGELLYYICVAVTKVAILTLYLRIAVQRTYRRLIWTCVAFVVLTTTACVLASVFQCAPIRKAWDAAGTVPGSCINANALPIANSALDVFQDAIIYVLPMRMLYQLRIPLRQKVALMGVFAVGAFVVVTGMIRLNALRVAENALDPSYKNYGAAVWSSIESNIGVVCACLPTFKALIDRFFPRLMGHKRSPFEATSAEGSASGRRIHMGRPGRGEFELEHGAGRQAPYTGNSATAQATRKFQANSSEEHLRGAEPRTAENGGIWKSTSMRVSREGEV